MFGHGLGYAYQLPFGGRPTSSPRVAEHHLRAQLLPVVAGQSRSRRHGRFAVFALTPLMRALRSASAPAKISAAVSTGLMVMCIIDPLPEEPTNAMTLGITLGSAMAFATQGRRGGVEISGDKELADGRRTRRGGPVTRVLVVGPAPAEAASRGGMATVITLMAAHPDARIITVPTYIEGPLWYRLWVGGSGMLRAAWLVARRRVDVLHVHLAHGGSVVRKALPMAAARWAKVPSVVHAHSYDFAGWFDGLSPAAQRVVRRLLVADQWLVLGTRHVEEYASRLRVPTERIAVLNNAVPIPERRGGPLGCRTDTCGFAGPVGRTQGQLRPDHRHRRRSTTTRAAGCG